MRNITFRLLVGLYMLAAFTVGLVELILGAHELAKHPRRIGR
jgi:hypothetical protein